jgi:hypothetical protein
VIDSSQSEFAGGICRINSYFPKTPDVRHLKQLLVTLTEDLAGSSGLDPEGPIRKVPGSVNGFSKLRARRPGLPNTYASGSADRFSEGAAIPIFADRL